MRYLLLIVGASFLTACNQPAEQTPETSKTQPTQSSKVDSQSFTSHINEFENALNCDNADLNNNSGNTNWSCTGNLEKDPSSIRSLSLESSPSGAVKESVFKVTYKKAGNVPRESKAVQWLSLVASRYVEAPTPAVIDSLINCTGVQQFPAQDQAANIYKTKVKCIKWPHETHYELVSTSVTDRQVAGKNTAIR